MAIVRVPKEFRPPRLVMTASGGSPLTRLVRGDTFMVSGAYRTPRVGEYYWGHTLGRVLMRFSYENEVLVDQTPKVILELV